MKTIDPEPSLPPVDKTEVQLPHYITSKNSS